MTEHEVLNKIAAQLVDLNQRDIDIIQNFDASEKLLVAKVKELGHRVRVLEAARLTFGMQCLMMFAAAAMACVLVLRWYA